MANVKEQARPLLTGYSGRQEQTVEAFLGQTCGHPLDDCVHLVICQSALFRPQHPVHFFSTSNTNTHLVGGRDERFQMMQAQDCFQLRFRSGTCS